MKNDKENKYNVFLNESALIAMEHSGSEIETTSENIEFSDEHKKKMEKLFKKDIAKSEHRTLKYVACAACLLLGVVIGSNLAVPKGDAWISKVLNYFFDPYAPGTKYSFSDESGGIFEDEEIYLGYVPVGFELIDKNYGGNMYDLRFKSDNQYFHISVITSLNAKGGIDTEGGIVKDITINGNEGFYCEARDTNSIVFHDGQNVYKVLGDVRIEETKKIAENLVKK